MIERGDVREEKKRATVVTTVCPIRQEAPTVMRFFLTYAYRHKAPLVRNLRAGKTRCSRIRVFVDRANDCRCIHIQNHVHRRATDPSVPFELSSMRGSVAGYTGHPGITVISLDRYPKNRTKLNTYFNIRISTALENFGKYKVRNVELHVSK